MNWHRAIRAAALRREMGGTVITTNGCFDILHVGHLRLLEEAKRELGNYNLLLVGVNTDDSVRQLKGDGRPVNTCRDRIELLEGLWCVDGAVPFRGRTPHNFIKAMMPDIHVKGGDYCRETLPEWDLVEELGGKVQILPTVGGYSTTRILGRV